MFFVRGNYPNLAITVLVGCVALLSSTACEPQDRPQEGKTALMTVAATAATVATPAANPASRPPYDAARWHPSHFKPDIDHTSDAQCLACHQEVLDTRVRAVTPAGVKTADTLAWYQTLDTYDGEQDTLHRRHLATPLAQQLMNLRCNTCHQGNDPREEASGSATDTQAGLVLRKQVNPDVCLMCHGKFNNEIMGIPGPWLEHAETFGACTGCHAGIRTERHQVNFLNAAAIETAGAESSDVCYGCHGGRSWYRIAYPYPRHAWPGMAPDVPEWAKQRPTESQPRFRNAPAPAQHSATATTDIQP
ncbi:MAG: hypothetical protein ACFCUJ_15060 [Thiotrichales bacterium]